MQLVQRVRLFFDGQDQSIDYANQHLHFALLELFLLHGNLDIFLKINVTFKIILFFQFNS